MSPGDDIAERLGRVLGGTVTSVRRLSGGASRVTRAVDLTGADGRPRALILQQRRGDGLTAGTSVGMEAALLRAAAAAGVPVPDVLAAGEQDGLDGGWMVVERLEGETIPRRLLRDNAYAGARARLTAGTAAALARIHTLGPDEVPGLPRADPLRRPLEFLDATGEARPVLELAARWLAATRPEPTGRTVVHGDYRMGNLLVDATGLVGVLDWELATPAPRPRTSGGSPPLRGGSAGSATWGASGTLTCSWRRTSRRAARRWIRRPSGGGRSTPPSSGP